MILPTAFTPLRTTGQPPAPSSAASVGLQEQRIARPSLDRAGLIETGARLHAEQGRRAGLRLQVQQAAQLQRQVQALLEEGEHVAPPAQAQDGAAYTEDAKNTRERRARAATALTAKAQAAGLLTGAQASSSTDDTGAVLSALQANLAQAERGLRHAWAQNEAKGLFALPGEDGDLAMLDRCTLQWADMARRDTVIADMRGALDSVLGAHANVDPAQAAQIRQAIADAGRSQLMLSVQALADDPGIDATVKASLAVQLQPLLAHHEAAADAAAQDDGSHYDFFDELFKLLEGLQGDWLDRNQEILEKYIAFFEKLTEVMTLFASAFNGFQNDGTQNMNFDRLWVALEDLKNSDAMNLGGSFATEAEAQEHLKKLGLEGVTVVRDGNGYQLRMDTSTISNLQGTLSLAGGRPPNPRPGEPGYDAGRRNVALTPAKVNAITSAKDALMERFNHISKVMTENYQRTLQLWDTLVKTLSGTIDAITEADRVFVSNLT